VSCRVPVVTHTIMDETSITQYIIDAFAGVETTSNFGYTFFFHGPDRKLPFATISASDNEYDSVSHLDRPGVFRLNIGVSKRTFQTLFGTGKVDISNYDFTALDNIMPHPEYAAQFFLCVLNPSDARLEQVQVLLGEAYDLAVSRHDKRQTRSDS
jgi:Family of unknown function (DUF6194)